jgi:hypothetical protein
MVGEDSMIRYQGGVVIEYRVYTSRCETGKTEQQLDEAEFIPGVGRCREEAVCHNLHIKWQCHLLGWIGGE